MAVTPDMKPDLHKLPTTGQILDFLMEAVGEIKGKQLGLPAKPGKPRAISTSVYEARNYKRIQRLIKGANISPETSLETQASLVEAVIGLFDPKLVGKQIPQRWITMSFPESVQKSFSTFEDEEKPFSLRLVFWIFYGIRHHEWLCPQLIGAYKSEEALHRWVEDIAHFYSRTLIDTARAHKNFLAWINGDPSWNLPLMQPDGRIKWPMCFALEWLESLIELKAGEQFKDVLFPGAQNKDRTTYLNRIKRGINPPKLDAIERWAKLSKQFKTHALIVTEQQVLAALVWSRALQKALKLVEKHFGIQMVLQLSDWQRRAQASSTEFYKKNKE